MQINRNGLFFNEIYFLLSTAHFGAKLQKKSLKFLQCKILMETAPIDSEQNYN